MSHKTPRKPEHYQQKSNNRRKAQSSVSLKYVMDELIAGGYELVTTDEQQKHRKASVLALAWFQKEFPNAAYSKSGRTVKMMCKFTDQTISVPVSDGQLSKDAVKNLRRRTGLTLDPQAAAEKEELALGANDNDAATTVREEFDSSAASDAVHDAAEDDDDDFDWGDDDDVYYVVPNATPKPETDAGVKKSRTVTRTRRPRESDPRP